MSKKSTLLAVGIAFFVAIGAGVFIMVSNRSASTPARVVVASSVPVRVPEHVPSMSPSASILPSPASAVGSRPPTGQPVPAIRHIDTTDPVVFITIDDGFTKDPQVLSLIQQLHVPVTPFITVKAVKAGSEYFAEVQKATGQFVQNHTLTHARLTKLTLGQQEQEICNGAHELTKLYRTRPWLFRPPFGSYNANTLQAAAYCGMTTAVLWNVSLPNSIIRYGGAGHFHAGDILLIHWRSGLLQALPIALKAIADAGLHVAPLQDYLPAPVPLATVPVPIAEPSHSSSRAPLASATPALGTPLTPIPVASRSPSTTVSAVPEPSVSR